MHADLSAIAKSNKNIVVAFVIAASAHLVLIVILGATKTISPDKKIVNEPLINIRLGPKDKPQTINSKQLKPPQKKDTLANIKKPIKVKDSEITNDKKTSGEKEPLQKQTKINNIKSVNVGRWAELYVQEQAKNESEQKKQFEQSFEKPIQEKNDEPVNYVDSYGSTHIRSKIGGKDVCFVQNPSMTNDQWSQNIFMVGSCKNKKKFKLNIPK